MPKLLDITDQAFGRLTALRYDTTSKPGRAKWICRCSCDGKEKSVHLSALRSGNTVSCGCHQTEQRFGTRVYTTEQKIERKLAFWLRVNKSAPNGCWEWTAGLQSSYGTLSWEGKQWFAHRLSYIWAKGQILPGLQLDHLCRNPKCVNPEHLEAVTGRENTLRGVGASAINHRKTHCPLGHPLSGQNLVFCGKHRRCRECLNRWSREYWAANKEKFSARRKVKRLLRSKHLPFLNSPPQQI